MGDEKAVDVENIDVAAARQKLEEGAVLVDVRNKDEWDAGHAPQARFLSLPEIQGNPVGSVREVRRWVEEAAARASSHAEVDVVVVCKVGGRSLKAAKILSSNGIRAYNLAGGMQAWAEAGLEMVSETGEEPRVK